MTQQKQIPKNWQEVELGEVLDYEQPTNYIVGSTNYNNEYSTPVLTAGKSFILGYTNETEGIYFNLPVIIFDDFTTENKFVNFPFKVKSSAMKFLRPKNEDINLRYVFLAMQRIKIRSRMHKRYYLSAYSKLKIPLPFKDGKPDLETQKKIVSILEKAEELKQKREQSNKLANEYLKSVFYEMFGDPNSPSSNFNKIDFLKSIDKEASNNKLKLQQNEFLIKGEYPIIDQGEEFIAGYTNDKSKVYDEKFPVIVFGDHTRILKFIDFPFALGADGVKILVPSKEFNPYYFYYCLKLLEIKSAGYSRHYKFLKEKKIPLPPIELQEKFAAIVEHVEKLKEKQKQSKEQIDNLFNALMQKAFRGELVE